MWKTHSSEKRIIWDWLKAGDSCCCHWCLWVLFGGLHKNQVLAQPSAVSESGAQGGMVTSHISHWGYWVMSIYEGWAPNMKRPPRCWLIWVLQPSLSVAAPFLMLGLTLKCPLQDTWSLLPKLPSITSWNSTTTNSPKNVCCFIMCWRWDGSKEQNCFPVPAFP